MSNRTVKPHAIEQGYPKEEMNGLFGSEPWLIDHVGSSVYVVGLLDIKDVNIKQLANEEFPLLKWRHIEPVHDDNAEIARKLLSDAKVLRKGPELDIKKAEDAEQAAKDAAFEAAAPMGDKK